MQGDWDFIDSLIDFAPLNLLLLYVFSNVSSSFFLEETDSDPLRAFITWLFTFILCIAFYFTFFSGSSKSCFNLLRNWAAIRPSISL